jgi:hypothetical protein
MASSQRLGAASCAARQWIVFSLRLPARNSRSADYGLSLGYDCQARPARHAGVQTNMQATRSFWPKLHVDRARPRRGRARRRRPYMPEMHPRAHTTRFVASSSMPCARARRRRSIRRSLCRRRRRRDKTRPHLLSASQARIMPGCRSSWWPLQTHVHVSCVCVWVQGMNASHASLSYAGRPASLPAPKLSEAACTRRHRSDRSMEPACLQSLRMQWPGRPAGGRGPGRRGRCSTHCFAADASFIVGPAGLPACVALRRARPRGRPGPSGGLVGRLPIRHRERPAGQAAMGGRRHAEAAAARAALPHAWLVL